jgi:hypothetical protein
MARQIQLWSLIAGAYFGCSSPIWLDGLTFGTASGALCMAILVTYVLTHIYHDLMLMGEKIARVVIRIKL